MSSPRAPEPAAHIQRRMPSSQLEAWNRICMAIETMADHSREALEELKRIAHNTSDMADELSEIKAHVISLGGS